MQKTDSGTRLELSDAYELVALGKRNQAEKQVQPPKKTPTNQPTSKPANQPTNQPTNQLSAFSFQLSAFNQTPH
jgi:cell division septation protein DedD